MGKIIMLMFFMLSMAVSRAQAVEYFLRADVTTKTMPDGQVITMWGFAQDSAFGANDGVVSVPGPVLTVPPGDTNLTIHLKNNLTPAATGLPMGCPVSLIIPGQTAAMTPARFNLAQYPQYPQYDGRIRSLNYEAMPGNAMPVDFTWTNLKPGTYLYQSATHIQCHVQMGLYGAVKKDVAPGEAYPGVKYDNELILFYSEIDPAFHQAVATNQYGPGKPMTSTINYAPKYFLVNGQPYSSASLALAAGNNAGEKTLLRFLNAGLETHVPTLQNIYMRVVAEDGNLYSFPKEQYSVLLPAGKTMDAVFTPALPSGNYPAYDRRLFLSTGDTTGGGMLSYLTVIDGKPLASANLDADLRADIIIDFGAQYGIWISYNDGSSWVNLHSVSPESVITADIDNSGLDDIIIDFGAQSGIWIYYNNASWTQLHWLNPESITGADLDNNGLGDVIIDFGSQYGIWIYYNNSSWTNLHSVSPESITTGDLDNNGFADIIIDFGAQYGIWINYNNNLSWTQLHWLNPESITTADLDNNGLADIIIDFGAQYGIWIYNNNSSWVQLFALSPESIVSANLDADPLADIVIDFGAQYGIWVYYNNATWGQLHSLNPESMIAADLDNNGLDDVIIDFGALNGIWTNYNNLSWVQLHNLSP